MEWNGKGRMGIEQDKKNGSQIAQEELEPNRVKE